MEEHDLEKGLHLNLSFIHMLKVEFSVTIPTIMTYLSTDELVFFYLAEGY